MIADYWHILLVSNEITWMTKRKFSEGFSWWGEEFVEAFKKKTTHKSSERERLRTVL